MKLWERPRVEVQKFSPDESVSACATGICNITGNVYLDVDGDGRFDYNDYQNGYKYHNTACGEVYEITGQQSSIPAFNAFVASSGDWEWDWYNNEWIWTGSTHVFYFGGQHVTTSITPNADRPNHS